VIGGVDEVVRNPDAQSATPAATFYGRTARPVTVTRSSGNHRLANSSSSRTSGTWEMTVLAHADVGGQIEIQLDNGGSAIKRGQFDLVGGLVHATSGTGVTASVDDLGNGWYRCRLRVSSLRPQNAYVTILSSSWARSYTGDGRRDVQVAEVTIDRR
jgi:hypothetical protein